MKKHIADAALEIGESSWIPPKLIEPHHRQTFIARWPYDDSFAYCLVEFDVFDGYMVMETGRAVKDGPMGMPLYLAAYNPEEVIAA